MNKRERMNNQILAHGENLLRIFPDSITDDPNKLARKVHRLEVKAHRLSTDYCNGAIESEQWEVETEKILNSLDKVLSFRAAGVPVFVNGDARGYALKIRDGYVKEHDLNIHRDWGGYGILAPEYDAN